MAECTVAGLAPVWPCRYWAATPATWGDAIEVPLRVAAPPLSPAETMLTPGAWRSTQVPVFENDARRSLESVAPTVRAAGTRAGDCEQALTGLPRRLPLPA